MDRGTRWAFVLAFVCAPLIGACQPAVKVGTTTTTSAIAKADGPSGQSCVRDSACASGFCDHPIGFCEAPGVCRDLLPCERVPHEVIGGACVRSWGDRGVPGACEQNLEEDVTRPPIVKTGVNTR